MILWGTVSWSQAFITNKTSFYVTRAFIGMCEGGFIPGAILMATYFYTSRELSVRLAAFWSTLNVARKHQSHGCRLCARCVTNTMNRGHLSDARCWYSRDAGCGRPSGLVLAVSPGGTPDRGDWCCVSPLPPRLPDRHQVRPLPKALVYRERRGHHDQRELAIIYCSCVHTNSLSVFFAMTPRRVLRLSANLPPYRTSRMLGPTSQSGACTSLGSSPISRQRPSKPTSP